MAAEQNQNYIANIFYNIVKHRWLILVPVLCTMAFIYSYTKNVDYYKSSAIVIFDTEYALAHQDPGIQNAFESRVKHTVGSLKFGDSLNSITKKAYPEISPDANMLKFNSLARKLAANNGIHLAFRRDNYRALTVSYTAKDPVEAYEVVRAAIDTLEEDSKGDTERRVSKSLSFFRSELEKTKDKLRAIDQEILQLTNGLGGDPMTGEMISADQRTPLGLNLGLDQAIKFQQSLPQLEIDLRVNQKELDRLVEKLESKDYLDESGSEQLEYVSSNDPLIKEVQATILAKRKNQHILTSQGYKPAHPKQKSLSAEIKNLENLVTSRLKELKGTGSDKEFELVRLKHEQKLRTQIESKREEINSLNDKITALASYKEEFDSKRDSFKSKLDMIAELRTRLEELKLNKFILNDSYNVTATELEQVKRIGRADDNDIGLTIKVAEEPRIPAAPIPLAHLSVFTMGFALSLACGIALVCAVDTLDTTVGTAMELQTLSELPVIGSIDKLVSPGDEEKEKLTRYAIVTLVLLILLSADFIVEKLFL